MNSLPRKENTHQNFNRRVCQLQKSGGLVPCWLFSLWGMLAKIRAIQEQLEISENKLKGIKLRQYERAHQEIWQP